MNDKIFQRLCAVIKDSLDGLDDHPIHPDEKLAAPPYLESLNAGPEGVELGLTILDMAIEEEFDIEFATADQLGLMGDEKFSQMTIRDLAERIENHPQAKV